MPQRPARPGDASPTGAAPPLGGLDAARFMRRHWQKRPLLVRQALPGLAWPISRRELFAAAARDDVESRLVERHGERWSVRHGPLRPRSLPPVSRPGWTLLVQGMDLHHAAARALLERFRFLPDARLDDVMVSWASDGGGVGPHVDSYDVFLVQVSGARRWRIGPVDEARLVPGLPLKILAGFSPEQDWLLQPGDLLYLPPGWGHDGVAEGECMTASVGFRAPARDELAAELLARVGDAIDERGGGLYRDAGAVPTEQPAQVPPALQRYAAEAAMRRIREPHALDRALGEYLTEPKPRVWFQASAIRTLRRGVTLAPSTRMMYDVQHVYINGESLRASGADARLMRRLADARGLGPADCAAAGPDARAQLLEWLAQGWLLPGAGR